jgi:hypothetical protein
VLRQRARELVVVDGQDLHGEQRGVHGAVDGDRRHRDALGHLDRGVERVHPVERAAGQGHADHRQGRLPGHRAREVGGHAGTADDGGVALVACR